MAAPALTVAYQGQTVIPADLMNTWQQSCDIIPQLRAFIGIQGIQVTVRGLATPGDGGGGVYWWNPNSTAPDNNGTVIVPPGVIVGGWNLLPIQTTSALPEAIVLLAGAPPTTIYNVNPSSEDAFPLITTAFNTAIADGVPVFIGPGAYTVSQAPTWPGASDGHFVMDTGASFTSGEYPQLAGLAGWLQTTTGLDIQLKTFGTDWSGVSAILQFCRAANIALPASAPHNNVVVIQGTANATVSNAAGWASEFSANVAAGITGATVISCQIGGENNGDSSSKIFGIIAQAYGVAPLANVMQIQAGASSPWTNGIVFNSANNPSVSGALILADGQNGAAENGILFTDSTFSEAVIDVPGLIVGPWTQGVNPANQITITGAGSGANPGIAATGTDTNVNLKLIAQGTGTLQFGTFVAGAGEMYAGYITIHDQGGTLRKVAVYA
jgi:hypothetical protein